MSRPQTPSKDWNRFLSRIGFITSLGDFLSYFAVIRLLHDSSGDVLLAAYSVPMKSLGVAAGGLTFPAVMSLFSLRTILVGSQLLSGLLIGCLGLLWIQPTSPSSVLVLAILFFQTVLKQHFEGAKESYSKGLGERGQQRSLQAQLAWGAYLAQLIGPIGSFFLIQNLSLQVPLWIDAASFFTAALFCLRLPKVKHEHRYSILRPVRYIWTHPSLRDVFLLRSVGQWTAFGLFNYLLFSVITEHYKLDVLYSTWAYAAIGLGAAAVTIPLQPTAPWKFAQRLATAVHVLTDSNLAVIGMSLYGLALVFFAFAMHPAIGLVCLILAGIANGLNAVATQSLRRRLTTQAQFPEVVGLEVVVGKATDFLVATLAWRAVSQGGVHYMTGFLGAAVIFWLLAGWFHWRGVEARPAIAS